MSKTTFRKLPKPIGVSEFRASLSDKLAESKKHPLLISDSRAGEAYVVTTLEKFNSLVEALEDAEDALELSRLIEENKNEKSIPWESIRPK